jgi:S-adenosylmethionine:diacylglycerol 3-amino-3-carboxypropyl transferase
VRVVNAVHFAQIREDGRLERRVVALRRPSRVVCIGSGGCTAFSILGPGVRTVHCVDSNPAQCALVELKKAAIRELDRARFLAFVGERPDEDRVSLYRARLREALPRYAREHWDAREDDVAFGVNRCGTTERFYRFVGTNLRAVCPDEVWRRLFACRSLDEQAAFYDEHFATESWRAAVRVLLSKTTHLAFFPASMFEQATEHDYGAFFAAQFELEVRTRPLRDNYFLSQLVFGSYLFDEPEGVPHYLTEEGYETARAHLETLVVSPMPLEKLLVEVDAVDAFFLSNVFDWMPEAARATLGERIVRASAKRAALLFRNMLSSHPLAPPLSERFARHDELSAELAALERSMMYRRITMGEIA